VAVAVFEPAVVPKVRVEEALPFESVFEFATEKDPPPPVTVQSI
jgi:hypothetical protein